MKKFFICILALLVSLPIAGTSYGQMPRYQDVYISVTQQSWYDSPQKVPRITYHDYNNQYAAMTTYNDQNHLLFHALDINFNVLTTKLISLTRGDTNVGVVFEDVKPITRRINGNKEAHYIVLASIAQNFPSYYSDSASHFYPISSNTYAIIELDAVGNVYGSVHYIDTPLNLSWGTYELLIYQSISGTLYYAVNYENYVDIINSDTWSIQRRIFDSNTRITSMQYCNNTLICAGDYGYNNGKTANYYLVACEYSSGSWTPTYLYSDNLEASCSSGWRGVVSAISNGNLLIGGCNRIIKFAGINLLNPNVGAKLQNYYYLGGVSGMLPMNNNIYLCTDNDQIIALSSDLSTMTDVHYDSRVNNTLGSWIFAQQIFYNRLTGYPALFGMGDRSSIGDMEFGLEIAEALPSNECVKDTIVDTLNTIYPYLYDSLQSSDGSATVYTGTGSSESVTANEIIGCPDNNGGSTGPKSKEITSQPDQFIPQASLTNDNESIYLGNQYKNSSYTVYTLQSSRALEGTVSGSEIDISNLLNGVYILVLRQNDGKVVSYKFSIVR